MSMARYLSQKLLIPQDENLDIHQKRAVINDKPKIPIVRNKKGGAGYGSRKALGDITNKASLHHESSLKEKDAPKEKPNIAEEMFLHDHRKCIEAQLAAMQPPFWDTVLPGYDSKSSVEVAVIESLKSDHDTGSQSCYPEPAEISMYEFSDFLKSSPLYESPPLSPICLDSPPAFSSAMEFEPVEFLLKEDDGHELLSCTALLLNHEICP